MSSWWRATAQFPSAAKLASIALIALNRCANKSPRFPNFPSSKRSRAVANVTSSRWDLMPVFGYCGRRIWWRYDTAFPDPGSSIIASPRAARYLLISLRADRSRQPGFFWERRTRSTSRNEATRKPDSETEDSPLSESSTPSRFFRATLSSSSSFLLFLLDLSRCWCSRCSSRCWAARSASSWLRPFSEPLSLFGPRLRSSGSLFASLARASNSSTASSSPRSWRLPPASAATSKPEVWAKGLPPGGSASPGGGVVTAAGGAGGRGPAVAKWWSSRLAKYAMAFVDANPLPIRDCGLAILHFVKWMTSSRGPPSILHLCLAFSQMWKATLLTSASWVDHHS